MVGYWIGKEHWGRGIASAALVLYLDVERHRPLLATVVEHNAGSRRVLEKAGFQLVARELVDDGPEPGTFAELHFRLGLGSVRAGAAPRRARRASRPASGSGSSASGRSR